mmetsp:Transcript_97601/g.172860  ORF Transcript_97601/g.172860 Transcript_97601/m.172860 type:complete len:244 (-) Transcript_97601:1757-2488(-)
MNGPPTPHPAQLELHAWPAARLAASRLSTPADGAPRSKLRARLLRLLRVRLLWPSPCCQRPDCGEREESGEELQAWRDCSLLSPTSRTEEDVDPGSPPALRWPIPPVSHECICLSQSVCHLKPWELHARCPRTAPPTSWPAHPRNFVHPQPRCNEPPSQLPLVVPRRKPPPLRLPTTCSPECPPTPLALLCPAPAHHCATAWPAQMPRFHGCRLPLLPPAYAGHLLPAPSLFGSSQQALPALV